MPSTLPPQGLAKAVPLSDMLFLQIPALFTVFPPLALCSSTTFSVRPLCPYFQFNNIPSGISLPLLFYFLCNYHHVQGRKQNRENISAKGPKKKQTSPKIAASIVTSIPCLCSDPWHPTAPHSSTLAWKMPWTEEPSRLQSMGSRRVGQDRATSLSLFTFMHWRRKWQPTPVFLLGESQERRSLVGCCLWGCTESDTSEET